MAYNLENENLCNFSVCVSGRKSAIIKIQKVEFCGNRLTPYYRGGVIYTPVGGKATIRPVMTKTDVQALLPELPGLPELTDVPTDIKQQSGFYREILAAHDCRKLLQLCKTIYNKQKQLAARRRTVSATELRSWKTAEEMLHQEFAFVLGKQPSEIKAYLEDAFAS